MEQAISRLDRWSMGDVAMFRQLTPSKYLCRRIAP
jgi:hypothetical protein